MSKNIVIYGAGGFGREVAWLIERINNVQKEWEILGFIDDGKNELYGQNINSIKLLGGKEWFANNQAEVYVTCPVGNSKVRRAMFQYLAQYPNVKHATLIDPSAVIGASSIIDSGSIICHSAKITVNAKIGKGVIVNIGSSVGHDSDIGDYSTLFVNVMVSGMVSLAENSEIGSGAFLLQGLRVCNDVVVAPLSSVLRNITESGTYAGNPARRIK